MSNDKKPEIIRVVRVLEYIGTLDWIRKTMENNAVNGLMQTGYGVISEIGSYTNYPKEGGADNAGLKN